MESDEAWMKEYEQETEKDLHAFVLLRDITVSVA
jgi:hypothetical protein